MKFMSNQYVRHAAPTKLLMMILAMATTMTGCFSPDTDAIAEKMFVECNYAYGNSPVCARWGTEDGDRVWEHWTQLFVNSAEEQECILSVDCSNLEQGQLALNECFREWGGDPLSLDGWDYDNATRTEQTRMDTCVRECQSEVLWCGYDESTSGEACSVDPIECVHQYEDCHEECQKMVMSYR